MFTSLKTILSAFIGTASPPDRPTTEIHPPGLTISKAASKTFAALEAAIIIASAPLPVACKTVSTADLPPAVIVISAPSFFPILTYIHF